MEIGSGEGAGGSGTLGEARTVGELGEAEVLRRVLARLSPADAASVGPGDDCAVLEFAGDAAVTSDTMVEGPDFRLDWHSGRELGWKLAATNLSDVAAMGARPVALTVSLACPRDTPVAVLEEIAAGLDAACRALAPGCGVVGGDLTRAPVLIGAVTALGDLEGRPPVLRSGARVGDRIAYAGQLGLAGLGLSALFGGDVPGGAVPRGDAPGGTSPSEVLARLRATHPVELAAQLTPEPPVGLGVAAAAAGATAMLDVSDGLTLDAARLGAASGVTLDLDPSLLTAGFGVQSGVRVPLDAMLGGGEDHGLLATFPPGARLPPGFMPVGDVRERRGEVQLGGSTITPRGWDPYARRG